MHELSNIDDINKTGMCSQCGEVKLKYYNRKGKAEWTCRNLVRQRSRDYHRKNKKRIAHRILKNRYKCRYNINITDEILKASLLSRCCNCCGKESPRPLIIDHDHKTGEIRGFLCYRCNVGLGFFDDCIDGVQKALDYLNKKTNQHLLHSC
jgi:hypothetical protein